MKKFVGFGFAALAGLYALGFVLPDSVHVERALVIDAPAEKIFPGQGGGVGTIEISPWEGKSRVVWSFDTQMRDDTPVFARPLATYFGFFMDSLLGPMFENGLDALKDVAQS